MTDAQKDAQIPKPATMTQRLSAITDLVLNLMNAGNVVAMGLLDALTLTHAITTRQQIVMMDRA